VQAFAQIIWPQLAPRLRWPLLAVLAYGLTVVDMALIIGPATPPTLAVLAWQWLSDADLLTQSQGVAAAGWLTGTVLVGGVVTVWLVGAAPSRRMLGHGQRLMLAWAAYLPKPGFVAGWPPNVVWTLIFSTYAAVWFALTVGSVSGVWPFPQVWPELWTLNAWQQVASSAHTVWTTLGLGVASASVCLLWSVAWLELAPRRWQQALQPWFLLPLVLPSVLWVVGLYSLALHTRLEGQWLGLSLAHAVMVLPYVLLALVPAYQAVDPRQAALVASMGHGRWVYLWRVKWPLLKRAIASAWAVGFAVSVAQYLPTLYVGAGRFATVTTEAVTLAAGAQRSLMSAYASLQMLLPIAAFALAAWLGRPRRFEKIAPMKAAP
jgi:putative thiamine transport system permease protein